MSQEKRYKNKDTNQKNMTQLKLKFFKKLKKKRGAGKKVKFTKEKRDTKISYKIKLKEYKRKEEM